MSLRAQIGFVLMLGSMLCACAHDDWRTAERGSAGLAPDPKVEKEAIVQLYAARAVSWRGYFAVHSWIAVKPKNAAAYTTYHVMGYRIKRTGSAVVVSEDTPDRYWFGAKPTLIRTLKGKAAEQAIGKISDASRQYPYAATYRAWPGPNSNTYISYILRRTPEFSIELPPNAIGKDWINEGDLFGMTESGTGVQVSLFGLLGLTVGLAEGLEVNVLGLSLGIDFWRPALKLPLIGRVGFPDAPVFPHE